MTDVVALHPAVAIAPQAPYSWVVRREGGSSRWMTPTDRRACRHSRRRQAHPPEAPRCRPHWEADAWEVERLDHLTAVVDTWALPGRLDLTTEAEAVGEYSTVLRVAARPTTGYRGSDEDPAQTRELAEVALGR
jgi:hypothetical protein